MLSHDLIYAARTLRKSPVFALTAIVTIALGIGASTAIFSVVNAVLLRPLPYADAQRLVLVWGELRARNVTYFPFSPGDYEDLRKDTTLFDDFAAVTTGRQPLAGDDAEPEQIRVAGVTANFFRMMGGRIALGRDFAPADCVPQPAPPQGGNAPQANPPRLPAVAILSEGLWKRRYGGDPRVIGRTVDLGGGRAQIVGVLEPGFELLFPPRRNIQRVPDLWTAMRLDPEHASRINVFLNVIGRLKQGVSHQRAQEQVDRVAADLRKRFPIKQTAGLYFRVTPMRDDVVAEVKPAILALMGAVIFLLLIACANVANLLLVRASLRGRELAVRAALGGSRWRLVRQMLAESLLLAGCGAIAGLVLARFGIDLLLVLKPENLPRIDSIAIDPQVLVFTALAALAAAAVFGVVPALRASRPDVVDVLRAAGRTSGLGSGALLRNSVVVAEVALSFVLLIGSGLMLRSFVVLQRVDPGYDPQHVLTFLLPGPRGNPEQRAAFMRQTRERLRALPSVQSVTASTPLPLDGQDANGRWGTEEALTDPAKFQQATFYVVLPGYFETLRTRLIEGRTFTEADNAADRKYVIVDQRLASKAFPNQSAVGKRLIARLGGDQPDTFEIIGVVAHQRHGSLAAEGRESIYYTDGFLGHGRAGRWAIRTDGDPARLAPAVRAEIARIDSRLPLAEMQPMQAFVDRAQAQTRFALVLIAIFAAIAALLAAVGLYGVLSNVVRQRTAEIGVRMALGAPPQSILRLVVGHGLRLSAAGIALGLLAAFALTRVMIGMLVGVEPGDPATFATIALLFFGVAAVACWLPARRAAGLDPTVALREE
jgi:predicted permease